MCLDEKTIAEVENYIAEAGAELIAGLKCCNATTYQNQQVFRFLPGHKSAILSIPSQIRDMDAIKTKKSKPMLEFKKLLTSADLKMLLLIKLNKSALKLGFKEDSFDEVHLSDIQTIITNNDFTAKCTVQCFGCNVTINALYKGSWSTSNVIRHLKTRCLKGDINPSHEENLTNSNMCEYKLTFICLQICI